MAKMWAVKTETFGIFSNSSNYSDDDFRSSAGKCSLPSCIAVALSAEVNCACSCSIVQAEIPQFRPA